MVVVVVVVLMVLVLVMVLVEVVNQRVALVGMIGVLVARYLVGMVVVEVGVVVMSLIGFAVSGGCNCSCSCGDCIIEVRGWQGRQAWCNKGQI